MSDQTPPPSDPTPPSGDVPPPPPPPPPPPAGYGTPPPPPPGYAAPPASGGGYTAPDAIKYGWGKFSKAPGQLIVPVLVVAVIVIVVAFIVQLLLAATLLATDDCTQVIFGVEVESQCGPGFFMSLLGSAIGGFFISVVAGALGAGLIKAALNVADGREASLNEVFATASQPKVITTAVLVAVASALGVILCYVGSIVVGFLTMFAMFFVVDKGMEPVDAIKASFQFTTGHLGETVVFYLLAVVCIIVGAILCGVGLLAAIPVVLLGAAYTFRTLHGEPVAPPA
jgi:uncharacterized membrane protein